MAEAAESSTIEVQPDDNQQDVLAQEKQEFDTQFGTPPVDGDPLKAPPAEETKLLAGKYKTPEELEKGYTELTKLLRGKGNLPPEEYDLELPEGVESLSEEEVELFKEMGLDNDRAQKFINHFHEKIVPQLQEVYVKAEVSELGRVWGMDPSGQAFQNRLAAVKEWAQENYPPEVVQALSASAQGVQSLVAAMEAAQHQPIQQSGPVELSKVQLESLVQDERYWTDEAFRADVERQLRQSLGS